VCWIHRFTRLGIVCHPTQANPDIERKNINTNTKISTMFYRMVSKSADGFLGLVVGPEALFNQISHPPKRLRLCKSFGPNRISVAHFKASLKCAYIVV